MDVICDQCKAEYEFDETLLGERGTTVKCSACGHVFRVMPPNREAGRSQLKLRYAQDGRVKVLSSLRELQQRIRSGEVGLDDELGRDGFPFRPLREVPELRNFFARSPEKTTVRPDAEEVNALAERARGDAPARAEPQPAGGPGPRRPDQVLHGTMMGVGPGEQRTPFVPRAPNVEARPGARERNDLVGATLGPTAAMMRGPEVPDDAPTTVAAIPPSETRERSLAGSKTPTHLGTPPQHDFGLGGRPVPSGPAPAPVQPAVVPAPVHAAAPAPAPVPPAAVPAAGYERAPHHAERAPHHVGAPAPDPRGFGGPESGGPGFGAPERPRGFAGPEPGRRHRDAPGKGPGMAPSVRPMRLYVDDEEIPLERRLRRGSRVWMVPLLLLLGGGVWIGLRGLDGVTKALEQAGQVLDPEAAEQEGQGVLADAAVAALADAATPSAALEPGGDAAEEQAVAEEDEQAEPAAPAQPAPAAPAASAAAKDAGMALARPEPAARKPATPAPTASAPKSEETRGAARDPSAEARARAGTAPADPKDYGQWVARGDQSASRGDQTGAAEAYKAALALRPTGSEANAGLGFTLLSTGKTREALPYFDRAANSGYAEANIGLGDAYRKLGQPSSAAEAYQSYLDRLPSGARATYARSQLEKLGKGTSTSGDEGGGTSPPSEPGGYRPAGELTEPSAPPQGASESP